MTAAASLMGRTEAHPLRRVGLAVLFALFAAPAFAQEFDLRDEDLRIVGNTKWVASGWGGYWPIRLEVTNFGPGRDLELRFVPFDRGDGPPEAVRRIRVEQNATARLSLPVPLVRDGGYGRFEVRHAGRRIDGLTHTLSLPATGGASPVPALLVVSPAVHDLTAYQQAAATTATGLQLDYGGWGPGYGYGGSPAAPAAGAEIVGPTQLPTAWIGYTAADVIAVSAPVFAKLKPDERAAVVEWTTTGGRLVVFDAGRPADRPAQLDLVLAAAGASPGEWQAARLASRTAINVPAQPGAEGVPNEGEPLSPSSIISGMRGEAPPPTVLQPASWPAESKPFAVRRLGFGRIAAVTGRFEAANAADWAWLLADLGGPAIAWPVRNGLESGHGEAEFLNFPIPGVRGVPAIAFLTLITLFAIVIGPVNYVLLARRRRLVRMIVTVPAIAAVTTVLLLFYAVVSHGFSTKGRVRSVTLLDPAANRATVVSRLAVFSGLSPSGGLAFSQDTAVYPLYPPSEEFHGGTVDWTEAQVLTDGWLPSRTRTQFVTVTSRDERGRLIVQRAPGGFKAANGLSVALRTLFVHAPDGRTYAAENLAAGGEATLRPVTDKQRDAARKFARDRAAEPPPGLDPDDPAFRGFGRIWSYRGPRWQPQMRYGLLERHLSLLSGPEFGPPDDATDEAKPTATAPLDTAVQADTRHPLEEPDGFLAIADGDPGVDLGGLTVNERDSLHVIMGRYVGKKQK